MPTGPLPHEMYRSHATPKNHFRKYGRRVRCDGCGQLQRTRPKDHQEGRRIREMMCRQTPDCAGRLRTLQWFEKHPEWRPSGLLLNGLFPDDYR